MIKVERIGVYNIENAFHGMRNPLESWSQSDSYYENNKYIIGENDKKLAFKLIKAGSDHRKFMRQIFVSMDITAPIGWWYEMDTYKVATVRNSASRMHKLGSRLLSPEDFSWKEMSLHKEHTLYHLNKLIKKFQENKSSEVWLEILEDLPTSYNHLSTWTGNFETLRNIYFARRHHKQQEWRDFCKVIESLPYSELITVQ